MSPSKTKATVPLICAKRGLRAMQAIATMATARESSRRIKIIVLQDSAKRLRLAIKTTVRKSPLSPEVGDEVSVRRLNLEEIYLAKDRVPEWTVETNPREALYLEWRGRDFRETFSLMTKIAEVAEELNHHPEWFNVYSRLTIRLTTHDVGGLSELDFTMAQRIDLLIQHISQTRTEHS